MTERQQNRNICAVGKAREDMMIDGPVYDYIDVLAGGHLNPITPQPQRVTELLARVERLLKDNCDSHE